MFTKARRLVKICILTYTLCPSALTAGQVIDETITHDGVPRNYKLYLPDTYDGTEAWPLVLNMHGATSTALEQMQVTGMNAVADANRFLVVYPQAQGDPPFWQDDDLNGRGGNDVDFLENVIDALESAYSIDSTKVYVTGLSQGGAMSAALATELSDRIAAMASVSGHNPLNPVPARPLPRLLIHGTADPIVPIAGGETPAGVIIPSIRDVVDAWREINQCEAAPIATSIPDTDLDDESSVTRFDYPCLATYTTTQGATIASEVVYFEIENGGHAWPGGAEHGFGALNRDLNASEVIWEFFSRHELPRSPKGDFDGNGMLDVKDIDLLGKEIHRESQRRVFDVNADGTVTAADYASWVADLRQTWFGDANLDGEVGFQDFVTLANHFDGPGGWSDGDFDADAQVLFADFVILANNFGKTSTMATTSVPEPSSALLSLLGLTLLLAIPRRLAAHAPSDLRRLRIRFGLKDRSIESRARRIMRTYSFASGRP